jgi:hypothetical protein
MTRETKIGLLVAGSFLCLVCVVVASKWNRGGDPSKEPEEQAAPKVAAAKPTQNANGPDTKKKDTKPANDGLPHAVLPALTPHSEDKKPGDGPPLLTLPPPGKTDATTPPLLTLPPPAGDNGPGLTFPGKKDETPRPEFPGVGTLPPLPGPIVQAQEKQSADKDKPATLTFPPPQPLTTPDNGKSGPPTLIPPPGVVGTTTPLLPDGGKTVIPPPPEVPIKPFGDNSQPPTFPRDGNLTLPMPKDGNLTLPMPKDNLPTLPKDAGPTFPLPKDNLPTLPKDAGPTFPLPKDGPTAPPLGFPTPVNPGAPSITGPKDDGKPGITVVPPGPVPIIPSTELPSTPPITGPGKTALPIVRDVGGDAYVCQSVDTSFAILSMRFYGTEKYADALLQYNRAHARNISNGTALLANPPRLSAGQMVLHPPASALETAAPRPAATIPAAAIPAPTNPMATIPSQPMVNLARPSPLDPGVAPAAAPSISGGRTYVVKTPGGESILDIAERALGSRSRWPDVWGVNQGNPAVRPPALVPAGTELKLPG